MNIDSYCFDGVHPLGEIATRPSELEAMRLGVLLLPRRAASSPLTARSTEESS